MLRNEARVGIEAATRRKTYNDANDLALEKAILRKRESSRRTQEQTNYRHSEPNFFEHDSLLFYTMAECQGLT
jgi:hypothetical protein